MSLGITEIVLILAVVLVLFGGKRIPALAKALGRAVYEYKRARESLKNELCESEETIKRRNTKVKKAQKASRKKISKK